VVLLVIFLIAVPIAELYVIVQVSELIGLLATLALLLAGALLGAILLRLQGRGAWRRFNAALSARRFPGREVADGLMIAVGATLLLIPGFITDLFGLILLIAPTRAVARRLMRGYLGRRFVVIGVADRTMRGKDRRGGGRPYDFDAPSEEVDAEDRQLRR
jgi:UPF0716 protein FxsA